MRKKIIRLLSCPNTQSGSFHVFAHELLRNDKTLYKIQDSDIRDEDDIIHGVLVNEQANTAYPISEGIGILLSDLDTDIEHHTSLLKSMKEDCPTSFQKIINHSIERINQRETSTDGQWNREEMSYYDSPVKTNAFLEKWFYDIRHRPVWNLFLPRYNNLVRYITATCSDKFILEIGCGSARSVSWIFRPKKYNYNYVGIEISWRKLLLAKKVLPEGDFFQASALNLPFKQHMFHSVLSFGVFHHLPRPIEAISHCIEQLSPNGFLALQEPINTPKLFRDGSITKNFIEKVFNQYEHSEHDNEIDLSKTITLLKEQNFNIVNIKYSHSIIYPILNLIYKNISNQKIQKQAIKIAMFIDQVMINTICRLSSRFGPRGVTLVVQR